MVNHFKSIQSNWAWGNYPQAGYAVGYDGGTAAQIGLGGYGAVKLGIEASTAIGYKAVDGLIKAANVVAPIEDLGFFATNTEVELVTNKFPNEPLDPSGKIFGKAVSVDGRVSLVDRQIPRDVDFVITSDGELVLGQKHTTLADNQDVLAAGQMKLSGQGNIRRIDNLSGHYQPTVEEGLRVPELLNNLGFDTSGARLQLYDFTTDDNGFVVYRSLAVNKELP